MRRSSRLYRDEREVSVSRRIAFDVRLGSHNKIEPDKSAPLYQFRFGRAVNRQATHRKPIQTQSPPAASPSGLRTVTANSSPHHPSSLPRPAIPHPTRNPTKKIPPTLPTISPIRCTIDPVSSQPGPESEKPPAAGRALQPPPPLLTSLLSRFWPQAIETKYFSQFHIAQTAENKQLICRIYQNIF